MNLRNCKTTPLFCKTDKGISRVFNPQSAPQFGGIWERLIRVFKHTFFKIAGTRQLTPPTWETLTTQIKNMMNNRPLTTVSSDHRDDETLTPNHFLLGRPTSVTPSALLETRNLHQIQNCNWRVLQQLVNNFWERFMKEYLPNLTTMSKRTRFKFRSGRPRLIIGGLLSSWTLANGTS